MSSKGKGKAHPCTGTEALYSPYGPMGSRGTSLLFLDHGTRSGKDPVPIVQETGCTPGQVWTGAENLAFTGIRSPDRPARSQSLYRLSYRALLHTKLYLILYLRMRWEAIMAGIPVYPCKVVCLNSIQAWFSISGYLDNTFLSVRRQLGINIM